jgi:hypothetical protein
MLQIRELFQPFRGTASRWLAVALAAAFAPAAAAAPVVYAITLDAEASSVAADVDISLGAPGSLIGNWHATDNPTGTRTKPGALGPPFGTTFGPTDNEPIPAGFTPMVQGMADSPTTGAWVMSVDTIAGTVDVSGFAVNLLAGDAVALELVVEVSFSSFRTRAPDSTYIGATLPLPLGEASLTSLAAVQTGPAVIGTLTPAGPDTYNFAALVPVLLSGGGDALGNPFALDDTATTIALAGEITLAGETAVITAMLPIEFAFAGPPTPEGSVALPPLNVPVPTILPPGSTANLVANLTLTSIDAAIDATVSIFGLGVRQTVTEFGACCYLGECVETTPDTCRPYVCDAVTNDILDCGGPCGTTCYGDGNGDGFVTAADRGFISASIGITSFPYVCQYDMDGNGFINAADRGFVSAEIGLCHELPDYQNGSGMNHGAPDSRFGSAEFMGAGTVCADNPCAP